jgi:predicted RNA-binding Zn-ribbon protein involved in translation (DUF1610 family)
MGISSGIIVSMVDRTVDNNEQSDNFTRAVKTIVSVPKNEVSPKPNVRKIDEKYEEWACPECGKKYIRPTQHKHDS